MMGQSSLISDLHRMNGLLKSCTDTALQINQRTSIKETLNNSQTGQSGEDDEAATDCRASQIQTQTDPKEISSNNENSTLNITDSGTVSTVNEEENILKEKIEVLSPRSILKKSKHFSPASPQPLRKFAQHLRKKTSPEDGSPGTTGRRVTFDLPGDGSKAPEFSEYKENVSEPESNVNEHENNFDESEIISPNEESLIAFYKNALSLQKNPNINHSLNDLAKNLKNESHYENVSFDYQDSQGKGGCASESDEDYGLVIEIERDINFLSGETSQKISVQKNTNDLDIENLSPALHYTSTSDGTNNLIELGTLHENSSLNTNAREAEESIDKEGRPNFVVKSQAEDIEADGQAADGWSNSDTDCLVSRQNYCVHRRQNNCPSNRLSTGGQATPTDGQQNEKSKENCGNEIEYKVPSSDMIKLTYIKNETIDNDDCDENPAGKQKLERRCDVLSGQIKNGRNDCEEDDVFIDNQFPDCDAVGNEEFNTIINDEKSPSDYNLKIRRTSDATVENKNPCLETPLLFANIVEIVQRETVRTSYEDEQIEQNSDMLIEEQCESEAVIPDPKLLNSTFSSTKPTTGHENVISLNENDVETASENSDDDDDYDWDDGTMIVYDDVDDDTPNLSNVKLSMRSPLEAPVPKYKTAQEEKAKAPIIKSSDVSESTNTLESLTEKLQKSSQDSEQRNNWNPLCTLDRSRLSSERGAYSRMFLRQFKSKRERKTQPSTDNLTDTSIDTSTDTCPDLEKAKDEISSPKVNENNDYPELKKRIEQLSVSVSKLMSANNCSTEGNSDNLPYDRNRSEYYRKLYKSNTQGTLKNMCTSSVQQVFAFLVALMLYVLSVFAFISIILVNFDLRYERKGFSAV